MDLRVNPVSSGGGSQGLAQALIAAALAQRSAEGASEGAVAQAALGASDLPAAEAGQRLAAPGEHGLPQDAGRTLATGLAGATTEAGARQPAPNTAAESVAAPWQATGPSAFGELAAAPLTPVWVQSLQAPPLAHQPWPAAHERVQAREQPREEPRRQGQPLPQDEDSEPDPQPAPDAPALTEQDGLAALPRRRNPHPLAQQLPPLLRGELERRRAVLLWAPAAPGHGVQAWWLGFDRQGRAVQRRLAARGQGPAQAAWQWWALKRGGDDGTAPLPQVRGAAGTRVSLALRVCSGTLPAPLHAAGQAWLDLTEAQRLWRELGTQWTWLTAWSPRPLPWMG
jgi:hypothetical protein